MLFDIHGKSKIVLINKFCLYTSLLSFNSSNLSNVINLILDGISLFNNIWDFKLLPSDVLFDVLSDILFDMLLKLYVISILILL